MTPTIHLYIKRILTAKYSLSQLGRSLLLNLNSENFSLSVPLFFSIVYIRMSIPAALSTN